MSYYLSINGNKQSIPDSGIFVYSILSDISGVAVSTAFILRTSHVRIIPPFVTGQTPVPTNKIQSKGYKYRFDAAYNMPAVL